MLLEQEEELGPGEKEEKGSQVARSVTVEQTGTRKTEKLFCILAQNFSKPGWGNKEEKGCQEKNCNVCTVDHGDVLALLDSHLFKLLDSHPENHDRQNKRVSSRSNQDGEATKEKQKDIFKDRPKTFYPVSATDFAAYVHQVSEQQQI